MNKSTTTILATMGAATVAALLTAVVVDAGGPGSGSGNGMGGMGRGNGTGDGTGYGGRHGRGNGSMMIDGLLLGDTTLPSDAEVATLLHMVEEEKLAHDVYVALGDQWGTSEFDRIAASESRHMAAVSHLLDAYGIENPTSGAAAGEFDDPNFDALYTQLLAQGSESLDAALGVGVTIEQRDIDDLQQAMADTDRAAIDQVYSNLLRGSQRHLRAFEALQS